MATSLMWRMLARPWVLAPAHAGHVGARAERPAGAGDARRPGRRSLAAISRNVCSSSSHIAPLAAFFFSGRFSVIVTIPSARSTSSVSKLMLADDTDGRGPQPIPEVPGPTDRLRARRGGHRRRAGARRVGARSAEPTALRRQAAARTSAASGRKIVTSTSSDRRAIDRAVAVEQVEQRHGIIGDQHRLGRQPLAVQRELDDVALANGSWSRVHDVLRLVHWVHSTPPT